METGAGASMGSTTKYTNRTDIHPDDKEATLSIEQEKANLTEQIEEEVSKSIDKSTMSKSGSFANEGELTAVMCIQDFPSGINPKDIKEVLGTFGKIINMSITSPKLEKQYAFIQMQSVRTCVLACKVLNKQGLLGHKVKCHPIKRKNINANPFTGKTAKGIGRLLLIRRLSRDNTPKK